VSLILEALKKLERDRQTADRTGFLVMAARPWPSGETPRFFWASLGLAVFGLCGLAGAAIWWWRQPAAPEPAAAAAPKPAPPVVTAKPYVPPPIPPSETVRLASEEVKPVVEIPAPAAKPRTPGPPPVVPKAEPATQAPEFRLTAISERDGRPVAVLNDRMVFEGEVFDDVRIVRIGEGEIEIEVKGRLQTVRF
jgi:hypothetical protein